MNELEKRIFECAIAIVPKAREILEKTKQESKLIAFPFMCDGVVDRLIYDVDLRRFTKIEYQIGVGDGFDLGLVPDNGSAFFKEVEYFVIDIDL